jgi:hypothetical protein
MRRTIEDMLNMTLREAIWTFVVSASATVMLLIYLLD